MSEIKNSNTFNNLFSKWSLTGLVLIFLGNILLSHRIEETKKLAGKSGQKKFNHLENIKVDIFPKFQLQSLSTLSLSYSKSSIVSTSVSISPSVSPSSDNVTFPHTNAEASPKIIKKRSTNLVLSKSSRKNKGLVH